MVLLATFRYPDFYISTKTNYNNLGKFDIVNASHKITKTVRCYIGRDWLVKLEEDLASGIFSKIEDDAKALEFYRLLKKNTVSKR